MAESQSTMRPEAHMARPHRRRNIGAMLAAGGLMLGLAMWGMARRGRNNRRRFNRRKRY